MTVESALSRPAVFHRWGYVSGAKWHFSNPASAFVGMVFSILTAGCFALFAGGLLVLYVNWILGLVVFLLLIGFAMATRRHYGLWQGDCPHCGEPVGVGHGRPGTHAFDCPICTKRVFLKNGEFRAL